MPWESWRTGRPTLAAVLLHEVLHERRDVLSPLAQRRHRDREDVEPVPEVLAEAAGLHLLVQAAVGGGHEAHVGLERRGPADALELPVLDHPQELGLQLEGQLADLVEEEGAAVGDLEAALALGDGPGESALLVAEELALDERGRQRRAVELDEGPGPARAQVVDRVGDELLADARLPLEEDRARRGRHLLDPREDVAQDVAAADDPLEARLDLLAQVGVVGLEPLAQPLDLGEGLAQLLLRLLLLGHVPVRPAQAEEAAVLALHRQADVLDPAHLSVRPPDAELEAGRARSRERQVPVRRPSGAGPRARSISLSSDGRR